MHFLPFFANFVTRKKKGYTVFEDQPLLHGNPGILPGTPSYPEPPARYLWGCVYWPLPAVSPRQFYKRNKRNSVKLCHTKPFLQNRDIFFYQRQF